MSSSTIDEAELIKLFNEFNTDHRVQRILLCSEENRDEETKEILQAIEKQRSEAESRSAAGWLRSCKQMISLHKEITAYEATLEGIETTLLDYQSNLKEITSKINLLQTESDSIQSQLKDQKRVRDLLSTYVSQILITPDLVTTVCQAPINASYLTQIEWIAKMLERSKQPGIRIYPSARESYPELQKLNLKALHRVRDFLISALDNMKQSQTNIQILQKTVLLRNKQFYHFLVEHHPQSAKEVRTHYIQTMSNVYHAKFRSYVQCLNKQCIDCNVEEFLGQVDWGSGAASSTIQASARRLVGNLLGLPGQTEQAVLSNRGNLFSLAGREVILHHLNNEAILSTNAFDLTSSADSASTNRSATNPVQKYYPEVLFRSHQKLLIDTATSEFLFLLEFFVNPSQLQSHPPPVNSTIPTSSAVLFSSPPAKSSSAVKPLTVMVDSFGKRQASPLELAVKDSESSNGSLGHPQWQQSGRHNSITNKMKLLFNDVFQKTLMLFLQHLKDLVANSFDCIGLLLMATINDFNRLTIQKRNNPCLDSYLDDVQITIWPRLKILFDQHIQSIRKASIEDLLNSVNEQQRTHPHYVARRVAEFSSAFMVLSLRHCALGFQNTRGIEGPLSSLVSATETLLQVMSLSVAPDSAPRKIATNQKIIFLINNYDLILSVYLKRGLRSDRTERFEQLLQTQITAYVEIQLLSKFEDTVKFVQSVESLLSPAASKGSDTIEESDNSVVNATSQIQANIDVAKMEAVGRLFTTSWQSSIHDLHQDAIASFTNFVTGMEILKQILTELLLYYTRFQRVVCRIYPSQSERQLTPWVKQLVPTNAILAEIRTYSKTF